MKAIVKPLMGIVPFVMMGVAFHYAPNFIWQWAYNMKTPITVFTLLVGLLAAVVINDTRMNMKKLKTFDHEYGHLEFRVWTAVNVAAITALTWLFVQAVPEPNFEKEIVYKDRTLTVTKQVPVIKYAGVKTEYKVPSYTDAYDQCKLSISPHDSGLTDEQVALCHKQATEAAMPPYRTLTRTVYAASNYWDIFSKCNDAREVTVKGQGDQVTVDNRNKRMLVCQQVAHDASSVH